MARINSSTALAGTAYTLIFDESNDGGRARAMKFVCPSTSANSIKVLVAPTHRLSSSTPADGDAGVVLAPGESVEIVGVVNGEPSITRAWARPVTGAAEVSAYPTA